MKPAADAPGATVPSMVQAPIFFNRNRVFRIYKGGKLFHDFFGDAAEDGDCQRH